MALAAVSLDQIDHKILQALLADGRASFSQIAREVNLTDVAIKKRVESLKRKGVIQSIGANLNFRVLGFENPVVVQIRSEVAKNKDIVKKLQALDAVIELHQVLGEYNFLAKVLVSDLSSAERTINQLGQVDGILDVKTLVAVSQLKHANTLPSATLQKKL